MILPPTPRHRAPPYAGHVGILFVIPLLLAGCTTESHEVGFRTALDNVPGIIRGAEDPEKAQQTPLEAARAQRDELFKTDERGRVTLNLESPRQAVANLGRLLADPESDAIVLDQLISDATKRRMVADGGAPADAVTFLRSNARDIQDLLRRMPFAEQSLDVSMEKQPGGVYQLRLRKGPARGLRFDSIWLSLEAGKWKWLWVSGP